MGGVETGQNALVQILAVMARAKNFFVTSNLDSRLRQFSIRFDQQTLYFLYGKIAFSFAYQPFKRLVVFLE